MTRRAAVRQATVPAVVGLVLLAVYIATLARGVTFWDAGEFIASGAGFGIPHPPGTPLYVMLLRTAVVLLGALGVPAAVATGLVSAVATAAACALAAALIYRMSRDTLASVAAGIVAGTMATVWLNATETEVYALSLALSLAMVWTAERAGRRESLRWSVATAYLVVLAVPLHLSALLAAPAAVWLAIGRGGWPLDRSALTRAGVVGAGAVTAWALGRMQVGPAVAAAIALAAVTVAAIRWPAPRDAAVLHARRTLPPPVVRALLPIVAVAIAASAIAVLYFRAQHDPPVNQGNPSTLQALVDVVARRQYAVAGLWPRQAPLWLQLGNLGLYADWQVARSLGPTIFPTAGRTAMTLLFVVLGVAGAVLHWRRDRRTWWAFALLLAAGTVGAALYLNLKAGPSFGHGLLPPGAVREARERDYFFVLGWWAWGIWAGFGAVMLARRIGIPGAGAGLAMVPLLLNWREVDRTRLPDAALPLATAEGLLTFAPERAVLFVAGDNDTYPLWYAQRVLGLRPDVTVVTTPLLPADWYRNELARREGLLPADVPWRGREAAVRAIANRARVRSRPVAMAGSMAAADRERVQSAWQLQGPVFVAALRDTSSSALLVDTLAAARWEQQVASLTGGRPARASIDGTARYIGALLACPGLARRVAR
ncbi:MAG: DUF2723 domain-containing protein, partial [Gemmatimonadaceae bacterium]|nr:DUF2723 domain-containing protein [Gemmatimonadaceae bacterium]